MIKVYEITESDLQTVLQNFNRKELEIISRYNDLIEELCQKVED